MSDMLISRDLFTTRVNSTMMSINERFTYLQEKARPAQASLLTIRAKNTAQQQASAKNRRLAMQMEKRLSAMMALRLIKKSVRQRLGVPNTPVNANRSALLKARAANVRGRLRRARGRSLQRSQSVQSLQGGNLQRTASMQSLNKGMRGRSRSRSRSRAQTPSRRLRGNSMGRNQQQQRSPSVGRQQLKVNFGRQRFNSGSFGQQGNAGPKRGKRNAVNIRSQRLLNQGNKFRQNRRMVGQRGRGRGKPQRVNQGMRNQQGGGGRGKRMRGQGRRGRLGRVGQNKVVLPSKEELDKQLEQYMANSKSQLDKEIDTYMKETWNQ